MHLYHLGCPIWAKKEWHIDRVIFDTRALHASKIKDPFIQEAQRRKPKAPVRFNATGDRPFVRLVADPRFPEIRSHFAEWVKVFSAWIQEGKSPFMFVHAPDDFFAPGMARQFHEMLAQNCPAVGALPRWPAEKKGNSESQMSLFM